MHILRHSSALFFAPAAPQCLRARPMTPDGPPLLGRTAIDGLYVNIGHGSTGWTMSCGSAHAVAAIVDGADPGLDLDGLTLARLAEAGQ